MGQERSRHTLKKLEDYNADDLSHAIDQWVILRRNSERNRAILKRFMIDGISQEKIAEEFGLCVRHTQDIIYQSMEQLFKHI